MDTVILIPFFYNLKYHISYLNRYRRNDSKNEFSNYGKNWDWSKKFDVIDDV